MSANRCSTRPRWAAALLCVAATQAFGMVVIPWKIDHVPYWEMPNAQGQFGGYMDGSFEITIDGAAVSIRNIRLDVPISLFFAQARGGTAWGSPDGFHLAEAGPTGFSIVFSGPADYCDPVSGVCDPRYTGSFSIEVAGDVTKSSARLPVVGGGFNENVGHYSWYYGSFADSGWIVQVPEPATYGLIGAGLGLLALVARRRKV